MNNDLVNAIKACKDKNFTCVLRKGDVLYTSNEKGILPMIKFISAGYDLKGFSVADKIVGKAAAMLFVLAGVKEVYAPVMSEVAFELLIENNIMAYCEVKTNAIMNRQGDDICPMEKAVSSISEPQEAYNVIIKTLKKMSLI